jgi:glutamate synthase (NADPH/NADH) small chain
MPGSPREVKHAMSEGVRFEFNTSPVGLVHEDRQLTGLEVVRTRLVDSGSGRARPEVIEGSETVLPASALIFAFGYRPSPPEWLNAMGVETDDWGLVRMDDRLPGQTSNPAVFAAGDMVRGSDLVVTAVADARQAALSIVEYLDTLQSARKSA